MTRERKIFWAKMLVAGSAIPLALWAYEYGPNPGYCGVPFENGGANGATCTAANCHTGTTNDPANKGSVTVTFPNGMTYVPGVMQHLMVTISDPASSQQAWGFELTARLAGTPSTMAGSFVPDDNNTQIMCSETNLQAYGAVCLPGAGEGCTMPSSAPACPASEPLQYMEHSFTGFTNSRGHLGSYTYAFEWTPPATDVGNVKVYVAGNAGVNLGQATNLNDHIYATSFTLTPMAAGTPPSIAAGGVVSASAFGAFGSIAPGTWIEIYGSNLDPNAPSGGIQWSGSNFTNGVGPTGLDGVTVSIGGQAAYIAFVGQNQVNAQVPSGVGTGTQNVIVSNGNGPSAAYPITVNATQPGLWAPGYLNINGKQYVGAFHADGTYVLPAGAVAGIASSPAAVGETILMYGIGFGSTSPNYPAGTTVTALNELTLPMLVNFGSTAATLGYAGLLPPFVGLYQFNVVVPNVSANSAQPLSFSLGGTSGSQMLFTAVQ